MDTTASHDEVVEEGGALPSRPPPPVPHEQQQQQQDGQHDGLEEAEEEEQQQQEHERQDGQHGGSEEAEAEEEAVEGNAHQNQQAHDVGNANCDDDEEENDAMEEQGEGEEEEEESQGQDHSRAMDEEDQEEQDSVQSASVATAPGPSSSSTTTNRATYFNLVEPRSASTTTAGGQVRSRLKAMRRSVHRLGGPVYRVPAQAGTAPHSFLYGTSDFLRTASIQHQHQHLQAAVAPRTGNTGPPSKDWARLSYGGFSNPLPNGSLVADEPWVTWGPSVAKGSSVRVGGPAAPLLDYDLVQVRAAQEMQVGLGHRIEEVRGLLQQQVSAKAAGSGVGSGADGGAVATATHLPSAQQLHKDALALVCLKQQRELWARFLRWKDRSYLGGAEGRGDSMTTRLAKLPDKVVVKQRTRRQTRMDIKKFEREQKKRQLEKEEAHRKKLRGYLSKIMTHREEFFRFHKAKRGDIRACGAAVKRLFENRDKKVEREKDNEEKMRLLALKNNDMDEYIRLVETTRNERLTYLIAQTDAYIVQIADMVQAEQEKVGGVASAPPVVVEEATDGLGGEDRDAGMSAKARSYYAITHRKTEEVMQPGMLKGGELKEYQLAGLQWMVSLYNNQLSGILADEMGLGKTIQSISLLTYVMEVKGNLGPFLVVVPLSTLSNWMNEFNKWAPDVLLVQYKGAPEERKQIYKEEMESGQFNVLLTTYDFVMKDKAILRRFEWEYIIVDEGHRMKNTESKFAQILGSYYTSKRRLLLTGTPLQNNLPELWSLLNFLLPSIFSSPDTFDQWFNKPFASFGGAVDDEAAQINEEEKMLIIQRLHELLRPFMLRRVKAAVMGQLPTKVEKVLKCELSGYQRRLYRDCLKSKVPGLSMNNIMMHLRKCCNHPFLFQDKYTIDRHIVSVSGKLELLDRILPKLKAAGHRVLLFSQMTSMLDVLEDYFNWQGFRHLRLDGSTSADDREERMYQFNAPDSPYFIFALSTRAGGLGLNLATADTVIFYDSDWNPSMDSQAMDRAHRIGQKNDVRVFRLITNTAVEEKIISRANEKSKITNLVVEAGKFNRDSKETDRRAMVESLLRDVAQELEADGTGGGGGSAAAGGEDESTVPDDEQLNDMMATSQDELELYTRMDEEREVREAAEWAAHLEEEGLDPATHPRPPRLAATLPKDPSAVADFPAMLLNPLGLAGGGGSDTPAMGDADLDAQDAAAAEAAAVAAAAEEEEEMKALARGRKRKDVSYADNLSEKQFLRLVEKKAAQEEEEKRKSRGRGKKGATLSPPVLDEMFKLYMRIRCLKDEEGRQLAVLFVEKPPKTQYADYYALIKRPIDLKTIRAKVKAGDYRALPQFHADFHLLFQNALTYNEEGSLVYQDALEMRRVFNEGFAKLEAFAQALPPPAAAAGGDKKKKEEEGAVEEEQEKPKPAKKLKTAAGNGGEEEEDEGVGNGTTKGRLFGGGGSMYDAGEF